MRFNQKTTMGGVENVFKTTCWVDVDKLKTSNQAQRKIIIDNQIIIDDGLVIELTLID